MLIRTITAVVAGGLFLAVLLQPRSSLVLFVCGAIGLFALFEMRRIEEPRVIEWEYTLATFAFAGIAIGFQVMSASNVAHWALAVALISLLYFFETARALWKRTPRPSKPTGVFLPFFVLAALHRVSSDVFALNLATFVILPLWAGDTAAYLVGRTVGRHRLAPEISPGKTWEGAIANVVFAAGTAIALGVDLGLSMLLSATCGVAIGVTGQAGDLLESAWKRHSGTKDSGGILPGHGGILDRFDSFLAACPTVAVLLVAFAPWLFHVKPQ